MSIQQARLPSPPSGIAVAETPFVLSKVTAPACFAAVWQRQPLASFQMWLDALCATSLPSARLILQAETVKEAMTHLCQQAGIPDCRERNMLTGDIAALAHIFAEIARCDYLRLRLTVCDGPQEITADAPIENARLVCVYRGPQLEIAQSADGHTPGTPIANGVPFIMRETDPDGFSAKTLPYHALPTTGAPLSSLVLTLDPVRAPGRTTAPKPNTYH
ncbi:DUF1826 domain-containing protein [Dinoroseobacter sp. S76]|uniref:DUF1826 domain-containing protein n=1 Tax=Dinoroseobacter sp. S76 TaxID=3415124 RepID=UPI003C7B8700